MHLLLCLFCAIGSGDVGLRVFGGGTVERAVRVGVPFEPGEVSSDPTWVVVDARGRARPTEARVVERWADGSVRWLRVEFEGAPGTHRLGVGHPPSSRALDVRRLEGEVRVAGEDWEAAFEEKGSDFLRWTVRGEEVRGTLELPGGAERTRAVVAEAAGAFRVDVRCVEEDRAGLRVSLRLRLERVLPVVEFEAILTNRSSEPRSLEGAGVRWRRDGPARRVLVLADGEGRLLHADALPVEIASEEDGTRLRAKGNSLADAEGVCAVEGPGAALLCALHRFAQLHPRSIRVDEEGAIFVPFPADGGALAAGEAVGLRGAIGVCPLEEGFARALLRRTRALPEAKRWALLSGPIEKRTPTPVRSDDGLEGIRSAASALAASREKGARDFGDFRLFDRVWSNLEYDTALGLLLLAAQTGSEPLLEAADDALFHSRVVDRIHVGEAGGFPHQHAPRHARRGRFEVGHGWIEGAIASGRLTGDPAVTEDALLFGEALVRLLERPTPDVERSYAWPIVALAALADAFPGRGFEGALEARTAALLSRESGEGYFAFEDRRDAESATVEVSVWLQGGLLLEALSKYAASGGRRDVAPVADRIARRLAADGFDARANRLHAELFYREAGGLLVGRRGRLDPPRALYAASGLLRAYALTGRRAHLTRAREWLRAIEPRLPGLPDRHPANDLTLAMRCLVPVWGSR